MAKVVKIEVEFIKLQALKKGLKESFIKEKEHNSENFYHRIVPYNSIQINTVISKTTLEKRSLDNRKTDTGNK